MITDKQKFLNSKTMLNNKLLIELDPIETKTKGGLTLPDQSRERPSSGKVIDSATIMDYKGNIILSKEELIGKRVFMLSFTGVDLIENQLKVVDFSDILWVNLS